MSRTGLVAVRACADDGGPYKVAFTGVLVKVSEVLLHLFLAIFVARLDFGFVADDADGFEGGEGFELLEAVGGMGEEVFFVDQEAAYC